jgi:hypothetical protein
MPELFVGNVSKQIQMFAYRVPERTGIITQTIPIGGQIRVSPNGIISDLSTVEIDSILSQHKIYGLTSINELDDKASPFSGLVYSIGKPISAEKLQRAMRRKDEELKKFGQRIRQEAALAVNSQIEEQIGAPLRNLEMSFAEEEPKGGYAEDLDHIAEGVRVSRDNLTPIEQGRRSRRRA